MNFDQYLLISLMEECNEVAQRCSKALRFGLQEVEPTQQLTNDQRIMDEMVDLRAVVVELQQRGHLIGLLNPKYVADRTRRKREKIAHFAKYSKAQGILDEDYSP